MEGVIAQLRMDDEFTRRVRVLQARQRLEELSRELLWAAEGCASFDHEGYIEARFLLLTNGLAAEEWRSAYLLAQRAAAAYRGTSEVLHSRRAFGDIPEVLVQEWEEAVEDLRFAIEAEFSHVTVARDVVGEKPSSAPGESGTAHSAGGVSLCYARW